MTTIATSTMSKTPPKVENVEIPESQIPGVLRKDIGLEEQQTPVAPQPVNSTFWRETAAPIIMMSVPYALDLMKYPRTKEKWETGGQPLTQGVCYFADKYVPMEFGMAKDDTQAIAQIVSGLTALAPAIMEDMKNNATQRSNIGFIGDNDRLISEYTPNKTLQSADKTGSAPGIKPGE